MASTSPHALSASSDPVPASLECWFSALVAAVVKREPALEPHHIRFLEQVRSWHCVVCVCAHALIHANLMKYRVSLYCICVCFMCFLLFPFVVLLHGNIDFIKVLLARGAAKAMLVRKEAVAWLIALDATTRKLEDALSAVKVEHSTNADAGALVSNATDAAAAAADTTADVQCNAVRSMNELTAKVPSNESKEDIAEEQAQVSNSNSSDTRIPQSSIAQRKVIGAALRARDKAMTLSTCKGLLSDVAKWLRVLLEEVIMAAVALNFYNFRRNWRLLW